MPRTCSVVGRLVGLILGLDERLEGSQMKVGDLVMKRDGLIKGSPHYLRLGIILEKQVRTHPDGSKDSPVFQRLLQWHSLFDNEKHTVLEVQQILLCLS